MNRSFYYIRHGQTDWNLEGRLQGLTDIRLNKTGITQAENASKDQRLEHIDMIVSSPLLRALETASILAQQIEKPLFVEKDFKERSFGSDEGRLKAEVKAERGLDTNKPIVGDLDDDAEPWENTLNRANGVISKWLEDYPSQNILFVGHGAVYRALREQTVGDNISADNGKVYFFSLQNSGWSVE